MKITKVSYDQISGKTSVEFDSGQKLSGDAVTIGGMAVQLLEIAARTRKRLAGSIADVAVFTAADLNAVPDIRDTDKVLLEVSLTAQADPVRISVHRDQLMRVMEKAKSLVSQSRPSTKPDRN